RLGARIERRRAWPEACLFAQGIRRVTVLGQLFHRDRLIQEDSSRIVRSLFSSCDPRTTTRNPLERRDGPLPVAWGAYYFHFQQIFVKRFGGVMSISVPQGQLHIAATWKDDNLWVENYDPATNTCIFSEYSRGNVLQGQVKIKDCNPLMPERAAQNLEQSPVDRPMERSESAQQSNQQP
ncbi:MAG: hypothetical protein RLZ44_1239, partial [Pseudomonadota bacterium]